MFNTDDNHQRGEPEQARNKYENTVTVHQSGIQASKQY